MTWTSAPNWRGDFLDQLAIERLVDGDEDTLHQQRGDEILAANFELLGEIFHADAFGHGDGARDGHGPSGDLRCRSGSAAKSPSSDLLCSSRNAAVHGHADRDVRGRGASPGGGSPGAPPMPGRWPNPGRAPKPGRAPMPGRCPGPPGPPGAERVGCMGRRAAGPCPGGRPCLDAGHCRDHRDRHGSAIEDGTATLNSAGPAPGGSCCRWRAAGEARCRRDEGRSAA